MKDLTMTKEDDTFRPIRVLSRKEVAAALGVSVRTLDSWVKACKFPAPALILGRPRWRPDDVTRYIEEQFAAAR